MNIHDLMSQELDLMTEEERLIFLKYLSLVIFSVGYKVMVKVLKEAG